MDRWRRPPCTAAAAQHRRVEVVRIRGIDDETRDRDRDEEVARDLPPVHAAVGRLQDAVAEVAIAGKSPFAGSGIHDRVVRRSDREGPDRERILVIGLRRPRSAHGVIEPDSALGGAKDELAVALPDRQSSDPTAHRAKGLPPGGAEARNDRVRSQCGPVGDECGRSGGRCALLLELVRVLRGRGTCFGGIVLAQWVVACGSAGNEGDVALLKDLFGRLIERGHLRARQKDRIIAGPRWGRTLRARRNGEDAREDEGDRDRERARANHARK